MLRSNCFIFDDEMAVIRDLSLCMYRISKKKKNPKTLRAYSTKGNKKMSNPTINLFDVKSIFIIFRNTFDTNVRVFSRDTLSVNIEF